MGDGTGVGSAVGGAGNVATGAVVGVAVGLIVTGTIDWPSVSVEVDGGSRTSSGTLVKVGRGDRVVAGVIVGLDRDWEQPAVTAVSNNRRPEMARQFMYAALFESTILRYWVRRASPCVRLGTS